MNKSTANKNKGKEKKVAKTWNDSKKTKTKKKYQRPLFTIDHIGFSREKWARRWLIRWHLQAAIECCEVGTQRHVSTNWTAMTNGLWVTMFARMLSREIGAIKRHMNKFGRNSNGNYAPWLCWQFPRLVFSQSKLGLWPVPRPNVRILGKWPTDYSIYLAISTSHRVTHNLVRHVKIPYWDPTLESEIVLERIACLIPLTRKSMNLIIHRNQVDWKPCKQLLFNGAGRNQTTLPLTFAENGDTNGRTGCQRLPTPTEC